MFGFTPANMAREIWLYWGRSIIFEKVDVIPPKKRKSIIYAIGATSLLQSVRRFSERETGGGWMPPPPDHEVVVTDSKPANLVDDDDKHRENEF
ncbi:hypothetical protein AVEN_94460-1 [Araneus ventricosus]|uniref:Uncharacterized protein n=1 Tax=Araneus ventricosus TaxID=182803 RepID=A0A4Y2G616_ARAVE|nr:hypothetical protein AVEN_94460-1 [Araneus ventricosus]